MEDIISTMSGGMHVSQDAYDLESFKASLARTIATPSSPSHSSNGYESPRTRPSSLSLNTYYQFTPYNDDAGLAAAFAGDAFAPMWQKTPDTNPWHAFKQPASSTGVQHNLQTTVPAQQPQALQGNMTMVMAGGILAPPSK